MEEENMTEDISEFPTEEDWSTIEQTLPYASLLSLVGSLDVKVRENQGLSDFMKSLSSTGYTNELRQRVGYVGRSHIFMQYYFNKGIPDERFQEVSEEKGETTWYPDFKDADWHVKGWFDYFSDIFYYQLASTWDTLGHLINERYELNIKQKDVSVSRAVDALEGADKVLWQRMRGLINTDTYKSAREIRNSMAHAYLPNVPGMAVFKPQNHPMGIVRVYGTKRYITSKQIISNALDWVSLLSRALEYLVDSSL